MEELNESKEINGIPSSLLYALVEEALWAHRELQYSNMFDCVISLLYLTGSMNNVVGKRINALSSKVLIDVVESVKGKAGYNGTVFGDLIMFRNSGNVWVKTNATSTSYNNLGLLGICLTDSANSGDTITVLLQGFYGTVSGHATNLSNPSEPLYISEASNATVTYIAPSTSGNVVRIIGHTYWPSDPWVVRFNPDNFWVVI